MSRTSNNNIHNSNKEQDFDLRFPSSQRQNQLFQDTLPTIKKRIKTIYYKNKNSSSITKHKKIKENIATNTRTTVIKKSSNNNHKDSNYANNHHTTTLLFPCSNCKRLYNMHILDIHTSQCAFLSSLEEKKKCSSSNNNNNNDNNSSSVEMDEDFYINNNNNTKENNNNNKGNTQQQQRRKKRIKVMNDIFQTPVFTKHNNSIKFSLFIHHQNNNKKQVISNSNNNNGDKGKTKRSQRSYHSTAGDNINLSMPARTNNKTQKDVKTYENYESDWKYFTIYALSVPHYTIQYARIPFPPMDDLEQLGHFVGISNNDLLLFNNNDNKNVDIISIKRYRIRMAMLRWHPDKFQQKFGNKLCKSDRCNILQKVKECSQQINALREKTSTA